MILDSRNNSFLDSNSIQLLIGQIVQAVNRIGLAEKLIFATIAVGCSRLYLNRVLRKVSRSQTARLIHMNILAGTITSKLILLKLDKLVQRQNACRPCQLFRRMHPAFLSVILPAPEPSCGPLH